MADLQLTPELLAQIQQLIRDGQVGSDGRSPIRARQLQNLNLQPKHDDPRPLFVWSAESPRDLPPQSFKEYPKLLFHRVTGDEVTAHSAQEEQEFGETYAPTRPGQAPPPPAWQGLDEALAGLSDDERKQVEKLQRQARLQQLQAKLAALSETDLEAALAAAKRQATKSGPDKSAA